MVTTDIGALYQVTRIITVIREYGDSDIAGADYVVTFQVDGLL